MQASKQFLTMLIGVIMLGTLLVPLEAKAQTQLQTFCKRYARQAVVDQRYNRSNICGFRGSIWHADQKRHYNWCMKAGMRQASGMEHARKRQISGKCSGQCKLVFTPAGSSCPARQRCRYMTLRLYPRGVACVLACPPGQVRKGKRCVAGCPQKTHVLAYHNEGWFKSGYCRKRCPKGTVHVLTRKTLLGGRCDRKPGSGGGSGGKDLKAQRKNLLDQVAKLRVQWKKVLCPATTRRCAVPIMDTVSKFKFDVPRATTPSRLSILQNRLQCVHKGFMGKHPNAHLACNKQFP